MVSYKRPWFFYLASLFLHLVVFAVLFYMGRESSDTPYGVHRQMTVDVGLIAPVSSGSPQSFKSVSSKSSKTGEQEAIQRSASESSSPAGAPPQSGFKKGVSDSGPLGSTEGKLASARERYLYELRVLIEGRKTYPPLSKRMRESGRVLVQFTINKDGSILNVTVKKPSPYERLNSAAIDLVAGIGKFKPLPEGFESGETLLEIPIEYSLH